MSNADKAMEKLTFQHLYGSKEGIKKAYDAYQNECNSDRIVNLEKARIAKEKRQATNNNLLIWWCDIY